MFAAETIKEAERMPISKNSAKERDAERPSRRKIIALAAAGAAAPAALALPIAPATAYQGNMERALGALQEAFASLQAATPNKGGHRERAMEFVRMAINQTQMGIEFANRHGGGGAM
jgi:hypothetical protein